MPIYAHHPTSSTKCSDAPGRRLFSFALHAAFVGVCLFFAAAPSQAAETRKSTAPKAQAAKVAKPAPKPAPVVAKPKSVPQKSDTLLIAPRTAPRAATSASSVDSGARAVTVTDTNLAAGMTDSARAANDSAQAGALRATEMATTATIAPVPLARPVMKPVQWKRNAFDLYEISDPKLTDEFWKHSRLPGSPEEGGYQILIFRGDSTPQAFILRAGTQVARLADTTLPLIRRKVRTGALTRGGSASGLWRNFWNPADPIQPYLWPTGLEISTRHAMAGVKRAGPTFEEHFDFNFSQRPVPWIVTEIGGHVSRTGGSQGGGLRSNLLNPDDKPPLLSAIEPLSPWWHAAIGIPGIKWETALANRLLPEFYWLDPHGGEGSYRAGRSREGNPVPPGDTNIANDGSVMREWKTGGDPTPSWGNLAHTLRVRAGNLRYDAHFDADVYTSVIHRAMFDELPAPFGQWGFGFVTAQGAAHTLLRLDLFPWRVGFGRPEHTYFRASFLRFDVAYRDLQNFRVGLTTSILLDSRILRPGDKP